MANLIYTGTVRHRRYEPRQHHFSYKLCMFCFDINAIMETFETIPNLSIEKFNLFSFRRKDYFDGATEPLHSAVRKWIQHECGYYPEGKIFLLTHLACLNYCFNPISLYFVLKQHSTDLEALVIEVTNTPWGERHFYVLTVREHHLKNNVYHFSFKKALHVSPFMAMDYTYDLSLKFDVNKIIVHMENRQNGIKNFDATLSLQAEKILPHQVKRLWLRYPFMTHTVSAAIYWQAFKLWMKGIPFHPHPSR